VCEGGGCCRSGLLCWCVVYNGACDLWWGGSGCSGGKMSHLVGEGVGVGGGVGFGGVAHLGGLRWECVGCSLSCARGVVVINVRWCVIGRGAKCESGGGGDLGVLLMGGGRNYTY